MMTDIDPQTPKILGLLQLIQSSPALAEFIERPVGTALNDERREQLVRRRVELLNPYASNVEIYEAVRADFSEALSLTEELPRLIASLISIERSIEEDKIDAPSAMLLAGSVAEGQSEKTGTSKLWKSLGKEVLRVLHKAATSDKGWNAGDVIREEFAGADDVDISSRLMLALTIMTNYRNILDIQDTRISVSKLASVCDALFYGGVLNGISGRYHKRLIIDRLKEVVVSSVIDQTGLGQIRDLVELLADLFAVDRILSRQADDFAKVSKYLRLYLQALRIVGTLAIKLSDVSSSLSNIYMKALGTDASDA